MDLSKVSYCKVHPAIGIARVGGSEEGFIGPEVPREVRTPPGPNGFKDKKGRLLRQIARFRIYAYDKSGAVLGEITADNADVTWNVHVANTKAAWYQFNEAMDIPDFDGSEGTPPKSEPRRNVDVKDAARKQLVIDPGPRTISGRGKKVALDGGKFYKKEVSLGELRTDDAGRLLFYGGRGVSASKDGKPADTFANNDGWHDDVSDGPVSATVRIGKKDVPVEHGWIVVAPPDYAPAVIAVITMWDVIRDACLPLDASLRPAKPSFQADIGPLFDRLAQNQWVNAGFGELWGNGGFDDLSSLMATLASTAEFARPLREKMFSQFRDPAFDVIDDDAIPPVYGDSVNIPAKDPREWYAVTKLQYEMLRQWAAGDFIPGWTAAAPPPFDKIPLAEQPATLDRAALDYTIGGPFHPGCEMTWPMRQTIVYAKPFRVKLRQGPPKDYGPELTSAIALAPGGPLDGSGPGDVSRWMAVPWQTDTSSCLYAYTGWQENVFLPTFWPVRVPNNVLTKEQFDVITDAKRPYAERFDAFDYRNRQYWLRYLPPRENYEASINAFVKEFNEAGVVTTQTWTPAKTDLAGQGFPKTMQVELGVKQQPKLMAKAAALADKGNLGERKVDGGVRPANLPNPRKYRS
jgi:L-Lysine epsilon oxidase N-terminal/L-lysine epsilon oxidase C-terminal domain